MRVSCPSEVEIQLFEGKIAVCVGERRCGKSTRMARHLQQLIDTGELPENIVHINFADELWLTCKKSIGSQFFAVGWQ